MQNVVIDKPYKFIPPVYGKFWPAVISPLMPYYLNRAWGLSQVECRGTESLRQSVEAGHGIVLAPNHARPCDPLVLGRLIPHIGTPVFAIASWHLFMQDWFTTWFVRRWDQRTGSGLFLVVLALATIAVATRLNLLFTSRVNLPHLRDQRRRVYPVMAGAEAILGVLLLAAAALVAGDTDALASVLVTLAVATMASLGVIEPATTAAARIDASIANR